MSNKITPFHGKKLFQSRASEFLGLKKNKKQFLFIKILFLKEVS